LLLAPADLPREKESNASTGLGCW